jgi:lipoprotein-anchoring transpeptidase ErfK/SrfK
MCYVGVGLLAVQIWFDFRAEAQRRAAGLFAPSDLGGLINSMEFVPTTLANRGASIVVKLNPRQVRLYRYGELIQTYPAAIGMDDWQTPTGEFVVEDMRRHPVWQHPITKEDITGPENPLGSRWIGFWQDERHHIGLHGTNQEGLIGQAVSHGCVRMREADIQALFEQVSIGTPVTVEP